MFFRRELGLREGVAEHAAHAAAGGIHMALHALQAHLRREVRLRIRRARECDQREYAEEARSKIFERIIGRLLR